jgi:hypothetical protein
MQHRSFAAVTLSAGLLCASTPQSFEALPLRTSQVNIQIPNILPSAISERLGNIVLVDDQTPTLYMDTRASGVMIGPNKYLTAGHELLDEPKSSYAEQRICGNVQVSQRSKIPNGTYLAVNNMLLPTYGQTLNAQQTAASFRAPDDFDSVPDIGLIETTTTALSVPAATTVHIGARATVGEVLYSANYEPTSQGIRRDPNQLFLNSPGAARTIYDMPAVYAVVVLAVLHNKDLLVAEGLRSYGEVNDDLSRATASGGADFSSDGSLVGETVAGGESRETVRQVVENYGVTTSIMPYNNLVSYAIIQPVTEQLVSTLQRTINTEPADCPKV